MSFKNVFNILIILTCTLLVTLFIRFLFFLAYEKIELERAQDLYDKWTGGEIPNEFNFIKQKDKKTKSFLTEVDNFLTELSQTYQSQTDKVDTSIFVNTLKPSKEILKHINKTPKAKKHYRNPNDAKEIVSVSAASFFLPNENNKLDKLDSLAFGYFAQYFCRKYQEASKPFSKDSLYVKSLMKTFGLPITNKPHLAIAQIFLLNTKTKNFSVFPGFDVEQGGEYDYQPASRDWFKAWQNMINKKEPETYVILDVNKRRLITRSYQDFRSTRNLMRTFITTKKFLGRDYILCVDFDLQSSDLSQNSSVFFQIFYSLSRTFNKVVQIKEGVFLTIILLLFQLPILLLLIKKKPHSHYFTSTLVDYIDANKNEPDANVISNDEHMIGKKKQILLKLADRFVDFMLQYVIDHQRMIKQELSIYGKTKIDINANPRLRGIDYWKISVFKESKWLLFGLNVFDYSRKSSYMIFVKFEGQLEATFSYFNVFIENVNLDAEQKKIINSIIYLEKEKFEKNKLVKRKFLFPDSNDILKSSNEYNLRFNNDFPLEILSGRFEFNDGIALYRDCYESREVKAVVRDEYVETLIEKGSTNFLYEGNLKNRIILYSSLNKWKKMMKKYNQELTKLYQQFSGSGSGGIFVSSLKGLTQRIRDFDEKDFGIIEDKLVVVTKKVKIVNDNRYPLIKQGLAFVFALISNNLAKVVATA